VIGIFNPGVPLFIFDYIFLGLSLISFFYNLMPLRYHTIRNYDKGKKRIESDGKQLVFTIKARKVYAEYITACEYIRDNEPQKAIDELEAVFKCLPKSEKIIRTLTDLHLQLKQYAEAEIYLETLERLEKANTEDLLNLACIKTHFGKHDEAIAGYQRVLKLDRQNTSALNNLGYEMIKKGAHLVAAPILEKAIKLKPEFIFPYCNLAYSKILQNDLWEGKQLIEKALKMDANCAATYIIEAIYFLKMNKRGEAESSINRALELDPDINLSDYKEELEKYTESALS
jgi:Tfp pilus assembly protein PilF